MRLANVLIPFFCGTTQEIVDHVAVQTPLRHPIGEAVSVLDERPGQYFIEMASGHRAWVGCSRIKLVAEA